MSNIIKAPVAYSPDFGDILLNHVKRITSLNIVGSNAFFYDMLLDGIEWYSAGEKVPRMEYYHDTKGRPYTYGRAPFDRTYQSQPDHPMLDLMFLMLNQPGTLPDYPNAAFDAVFMNYYSDQHQHLGWHADDSPEMDSTHPIAVISFGVDREIWFREFPTDETPRPETERTMLGGGSMLIMDPGMQQTHQHRIPKCDHLCGGRISLTFRKFA